MDCFFKHRRWRGRESHGASDQGCWLRCSFVQCAIIEMGVDRGGLALVVAEQPGDGGEPDTVHDALLGPGVSAVLDAKAGQTRFHQDSDSERIESGDVRSGAGCASCRAP